MSRSTASTSNLQISVEPSQSSFFAGEEFSCTITFTNTLIPAPQSVPLLSTSTFDTNDFDRRAVSLGPNAKQTPGPSRLPPPLTGSHHSPFPNSMLTPHRRKHSKSQSVDVRTFARQHQLQHLGGGGEEELGSDEKYYKSVAEEKDRETDDQSYRNEFLEDLPTRKKLIGGKLESYLERGGANGSAHKATASTPSKGHVRSSSVAVPGQQSRKQQALGMGRPTAGQVVETPYRAASQRVTLQANTPSPTASRNASSSTRLASGTIASNHPHSRKKSVAQVQAEDLSATFELDGDSPGADNTPTPSASVTPRESFDLRSRGGDDEIGPNFYNLGENSTMESVLREDVTQWSKMSSNGVREHADSSSGSRRGSDLNAIDVTSASTTGSETLLWTFAQFGGSFQIDESLIKPGEFEQVKERVAGGGGGVGTMGGSVPFSPVGGGEFGVASEAGEDQSAEGWGSYLRGALSLGGKRASLSAPSASTHKRSGSTLGNLRAKTLTSKSIPIFSNPPSMIVVDLKLKPGESRSYGFRISLPPDLPPSYSGRSISFVYSLTLGTNRLVRNKKGIMEQKSRIVRIPLRIYNMVSISGITSFFDLTNPIINLKDVAESKEEGGVISTLSSQVLSEKPNESGRRDTQSKDDANSNELLRYTQQLMASCKEEDRKEEDDVPTDVEVATELARMRGLTIEGNSNVTSPIKRPHLQLLPDVITIKNAAATRPPTLTNSSAGLGLTGEEDDGPKSSLQAVEILSRNSQKVSYDISKDGQVAAILTLIKSKYRLGDTVNGVVTINNSRSIARVVRIAATLETYEEIEATLSTLPATRSQKLTKKIHAEFHENTLNTGQVCFSLPIPSGATPDFVTSAVKLSWTIRMSFLMLSTIAQVHVNGKEAGEGAIRPKPPTHLLPSIDDGFSTYHRAYRASPNLAGPASIGQSSTQPEEAKLEVVECAVPLTVLAHSTRFTAGQVAFLA
ncbi:hypothetical protein CBS101457_003748 [Exobasidium rhododendri]|nr:hypothetical protein CBS101457_003748 [Exobasidium rhododendri]